MRPRAWASAAVAAVGFVVAFPEASLAQEASVSALDNVYDPTTLEVDKGTTITWTNNGEAPHTVTASDGSFDSGNLDPGDSYTQTFDEAGEVDYFCEYHGTADGEGMAGIVRVAAAEDPTDPGDGDGGGDDTGDDGDDADATDDETLPQTGSDIAALVYFGVVLIGAGGACLRLGRVEA